MINPNPVSSRNTPYGTPSNNLPRTLSTSPKSMRWQRFRRFFGFTVLGLVVAGGSYALAQYSSFKNSVITAHQGIESKVLSYDPNQANQTDLSQLHQAGDGRFNLLVLGIGGEGHDGALLTDTIKVVSLDTVNHKITVTSVPRDLYVSIPSHGRNKINTAYELGEQDKKNSGGLVARQVVGSVLGINISNYVLVDFSGAKEVVDALGGVQINVPKSLYDPYYPNDKTGGYQPLSVKAGLQTMDGDLALRYMRSRETTTDFDRAERQTLVLKAAKDKALSLGVLTNPLKISNLISALGTHLQTDMQTDDIKSFLSIAKDVSSDQISSEVLSTDPTQGLLTDTTDPVAGYIEYPYLGIGKYSAIQQWYQKNAPDPFLAKEAPTVTVVGNGTATTKQLQNVVDALKAYGFQAVLGTDTASRKYTTTSIFDTIKDKKPVSHNYIGTYFGVTVQSGSPLQSGSDLEVVYVPSSATK